MLELEEEIKSEEKMGSFLPERVRARKGTPRSVPTLHNNDNSVGLPEQVETVDED